MPNPTIPNGPCFLHVIDISNSVDGKYQKLVLVARFDASTSTATVLDDGGAYPLVDGKYLHKWQVYHAEPLVRPNPMPTRGWIYHLFKMVEVRLDISYEWRIVSTDEVVAPGTKVFDRPTDGGSVIVTI